MAAEETGAERYAREQLTRLEGSEGAEVIAGLLDIVLELTVPDTEGDPRVVSQLACLNIAVVAYRAGRARERLHAQESLWCVTHGKHGLHHSKDPGCRWEPKGDPS